LARNEDLPLLLVTFPWSSAKTGRPLKLIPIRGGVFPNRETPPKAQIIIANYIRISKRKNNANFFNTLESRM
jgi:hypothetical protein